jgi:hypothetical protein
MRVPAAGPHGSGVTWPECCVYTVRETGGIKAAAGPYKRIDACGPAAVFRTAPATRAAPSTDLRPLK